VTRQTYARLAGVMFLVYIGTGLAGLALFGRATGGAEGTAATLANLAGHATLVRLTAVLSLLTFFDAVVLGVALYALTRDEDADLALLALCCRLGEGMLGAYGAVRTLGLLSMATASTGTSPDVASVRAVGALLLGEDRSSTAVAATCFAVGSSLYSYLFLRARSIPVALAWLGVAASLLLVAGLPVQLAGFLHGAVTYLMWVPVTVFEVALALWLLIRGVTPGGAAAVAP
jgi:Domain of unknown function (DUF4386)